MGFFCVVEMEKILKEKIIKESGNGSESCLFQGKVDVTLLGGIMTATMTGNVGMLTIMIMIIITITIMITNTRCKWS